MTDPAVDIARPLVQRFEGCRLTAYPDPGTGGLPYTIGYGHTGSVPPDATCTQAQADAWLESDLGHFCDGVRSLLTTTLPDPCVAALTSFAYNVGLANLGASTLLRLINEGQAPLAAAQFDKWCHAAGKTLPGLVTRRAAEKALFISGLP